MRTVLSMGGVLLAMLALLKGEEEPAPKKVPGEPTGLIGTTNAISGTTLRTQDWYSEQTKWSEHRCSIGFPKWTGKAIAHHEVIALPPLDNDRYDVEFAQGELRISHRQSKQKVAVLDLRAIAPFVITEGSSRAASQPDQTAGDPVTVPGVSCTFPIFKTTLSTEFGFSILGEGSEERIAHFCRIGYEQEGENPRFVPVLTLPSIDSDFYVVKLSEGELGVTKLKSGNKVIGLNLDNLAPAATKHDPFASDGFETPDTEEEIRRRFPDMFDRFNKSGGADPKVPGREDDEKPPPNR